MTIRRRLPAQPARQLWEQVRDELGIVEAFPPDVAAAATAAAAAPHLPASDRTDLPLCTIDPAGSRDLDQAVGFERVGDGYRVHYAIADVAAFVAPGSPLDLESHRRGETLYAPDRRVPLYPPSLSEGAASLLPGERRPVLLWTHELSSDGNVTHTTVVRAVVRSDRQLDYAGVDAAVASNASGDEQLALLQEIGERRLAIARARGSVQLPTLEQEVDLGDDGTPTIRYRHPYRSEAWNAEISLLTGMAAASMMLAGDVGILRTLPPADPAAVAQLRHSALALGIAWPAEAGYAEVVSGLDPTTPSGAALLALVPRLLRGAGYVAFDGAPPASPVHSAVAAPYTHCTAPLRRLVDRYAGEICVALCAGVRPPSWATDALATLPEEMAAADRRAHALDRASIDLAEALVLQGHVGEVLPATVVSADGTHGIVQLASPAVRAEIHGAGLRAGEPVEARLVTADPDRRSVVFDVAAGV